MATSGSSGKAAPTASQDAVDSATADAAGRLRCKSLASLSCREAEQLLDDNFRVNDEVWLVLRQLWDCAVRFDSQLGEADRPWHDRNLWLQSLAGQRDDLKNSKVEVDVELLRAKLDVQTACSTTGMMHASKLAAVLESTLFFRGRCALFCQELEEVITTARQALRLLGECPHVPLPEILSPAVGSQIRRWRGEFDSLRQSNERTLRTLKHRDAASAIPHGDIEEAIDENWRFSLELVGLFEKVASTLATGVDGTADTGIVKRTPSNPSPGAGIADGAESLRVALENLLPPLLECKLVVQAATAKGELLDLHLIEENIGANLKCHAQALTFLTDYKIDLSNIVPTKFVEEMLPHPAAFGSAATRAAGDAVLPNGESIGDGLWPPVLRILSYNIFIRAPSPQFTHNTEDDCKDERLQRFSDHLRRFDVVCLQELYGAFSNRRDWLITAAKMCGLKHELHSSTGVRPRFLVDGGLAILSRMPFVASSKLTFEPGHHMDRLCAKGALYAKLQCGPAGPYLHVCTTHMQSTYSEDHLAQAQEIRMRQVDQLVRFLAEVSDDRISLEDVGPKRHWPLLLSGTLNVNGRRDPMDGSHSQEYNTLVQKLRTEIGEVRDLLYDVSGTHPVTYADTRLTASGEVPTEKVLTNRAVYESQNRKRQRLDYLFFFPQVSRGSTGNPGGQESVVPSTCSVEKFLVDRTKDVGAPITQLSDHYGVEATLAVIPVMSSFHARDGPSCESAVGADDGRCMAPGATETLAERLPRIDGEGLTGMSHEEQQLDDVSVKSSYFAEDDRHSLPADFKSHLRAELSSNDETDSLCEEVRIARPADPEAHIRPAFTFDDVERAELNSNDDVERAELSSNDETDSLCEEVYSGFGLVF